MSLLLFKVSRVSAVSTSTPDSDMVTAVTRHVPIDESLKSVQMSNGTGMPDVVAVNNQPCIVQSAALPPPSPPKASHAESASQLTTLNGRIIGLDGQELTLWGINWFGFEDGTTMVDGLWAGACPYYSNQSMHEDLLSKLWQYCLQSAHVCDLSPAILLLAVGHLLIIRTLRDDPSMGALK